MIRVMLGAIAALIGLLAGTAYYAVTLRGQVGGLRAQNSVLVAEAAAAQEARKRIAAVLAQTRAEKRSAARKTASLGLQLDAALTQQRPFADQPVPKEVQDALP